MQNQSNTQVLSSNEKGKHAELLAATAFLANGYTVMEPISPQPYDLAVKHPKSRKVSFVQVKTAYLRDTPEDIKRYGHAYLRVPGVKNKGAIYTKDEVDLFAAVWEGEVYIFPNREIQDYWVLPEKVSEKWTKLERGI